MKCPHCSKFIPIELMQAPVQPPRTTPERWSLAQPFLGLVWALDGNLIDATLLCMFVEDEHLGRCSSYSELAARASNFSRAVVQKAIDRLTARKVLKVVGTNPHVARHVDLPRLLQLVQDASGSADTLFLWLHEITDGSFRDALVLFLLIQSGAVSVPQKLTPLDFVRLSDGLYRKPRDIQRSLRNIAPFYGVGLVARPERNYWTINSPMVNDLLAQRADAWLARGAPPEPWEAGLQIALSAGSNPAQSAA